MINAFGGSPEENKRAIAAAEKRGEFNDIPWLLAVKRKPKQGRMIFVTFVTWEGAPIEYQEIEFKTIGVQSVIKPPAKKLPSGYELRFHDQWVALFEQIFDESKDYTFEQLDDCVRDWYGLEKFIGRNYGDCPIWDAKRDYCSWGCRFEDAWSIVPDNLEALFKQALPHLDPHTPTEDGIGNRVMPPSLEECLETMLQYLRGGKFVEKTVDEN